MLNNLTNFYNIIRGRMLRNSTTLKGTDIIPLGVVNPNYGGGYLPSAITVADLAAQIGGGGGAIDILTSYPVTTPAQAGDRFWYRGNEWHYMTQDLIDSIGWTGLVSVGFPAPVSKVLNTTIFCVGTDIPATDIRFNGNLNFNITPANSFNKNFTLDMVGLGNPTKYSTLPFLTNPEGTRTITIKNAELLSGLRDEGTYIAVRFNFTGLTATALNNFFTALPPTTFTATINVANNPGSLTCSPTIATSKGYTVIT